MRRNLAEMPREELKKIDEMSPWGEKLEERVGGWSILMELHNGNIHPLIWWYGRLLRLEDAPKMLTGKHYNKYVGKDMRASSWALLRRYLEYELKRLDKEYRRIKAREYREKKKPANKS